MKKKSITPTFIKIKKANIHYILKKKKSNGANVSVVFLIGYNSDSLGKKALYIELLRKKLGFEYLRFDYSGHGKSSGDIQDRTLSDWIYESRVIIKKKTNHPIILIGSSMGGWISLILAKSLNKNLLGILGIATAANFTTNIIEKLTKKQKLLYKENNFIKLKSIYKKDGYIFTKKFIDDSKKYCFSKKSFRLNCKIIFLYGKEDASVIYETQLNLMKIIDSKEISLIVSRSSDHRMSSAEDLFLIKENLLKLLKIRP